MSRRGVSDHVMTLKRYERTSLAYSQSESSSPDQDLQSSMKACVCVDTCRDYILVLNLITFHGLSSHDTEDQTYKATPNAIKHLYSVLHVFYSALKAV